MLASFNPRSSKEHEFIIIAIFLGGLVVTSLFCLAAIVGACFAISYELSYILNHLSSTQLLLMLILFYGLYRLARYGWRKFRV